ncbi:MAG: SUMF1/EgtB/PvdO family nonheme iron enzyme [Kiritimatiellia bacterium]
MNKACVYVLLLASFAVTSCAQKIQYPEAYGTYIKDGDKFSRLEVNTPQEAQRNFTASASILVFDRLLASPLVQPKEAIKLFNRHYVRFNVDLVQLKAEGEIVERHISKAGDFANLGSSLGLDVYPVPGHPDMLEFKPVGNFSAGLYTLLVDQQQYAFAIGLGGKTDAESEHNGMVDRYFEVTPKRGGFTFEEFGKASERGPFANNYRDNYFIQKEYYKSFAALDGEVRQWRENFENNIKSQNYLGCMNIIECLDAFDGTGQALKAGLLDSMAAGLRKDLDIDPLFVAARSAQFMRMEPLVQAFRDINEIATKRIKEINAKTSKPTDEERKTRLLNSILYVSQPLPQGNEKELIGKLEIFEDGIVDHFNHNGVAKKFVTDLAGISIGAHSDFRHIRGFFDEHPKQYYVLEFSKSGANGSYHFHSARERDDASAALQKAVNQFKSKLDLHDKVTAGNVSMEIDGDTMVYVVKSVPYLWSPVINLPDNCAAVYWKQIEPNRIMGGPDDIEVQLQNGKIVDRSQIPSGNCIRIRSAENEGVITGKLYIVLGPATRPVIADPPVVRSSNVSTAETLTMPRFYTQTVEVYNVTFDMVLVPGDEADVIKPIYVGKSEVTWREFLPWVNISDLSDSTQADKLRMKKLRPSLPDWDITRGYGTNNYPALGMTRLNAEMYCAWLSDYTGKKYRLPTEKEWEHIIMKANLGKTELTSTEKVKGIAVS